MGIFTNEVKALDKITAELEAVTEATRREIARQGEATAALTAAETTYAGILASDALKPDASGVKQARERVAAARSELEEQAARLAAVRKHLWVVGGTSGKEAASMDPAGLEHEAEKATEAFAHEWQQAVETFGKTLARRKEIETVLARPLKLPEPTPSGHPEVADLLPIATSLRDFTTALSRVTQVDVPPAFGAEEFKARADFLDSFTAYETSQHARWAKGRSAAAR